jgi:hypothetical protein
MTFTVVTFQWGSSRTTSNLVQSLTGFLLDVPQTSFRLGTVTRRSCAWLQPTTHMCNMIHFVKNGSEALPY